MSERSPHISPVPALKAWLDEPLEDRVMALVEDPSLLELVRDLIEQFAAVQHENELIKNASELCLQIDRRNTIIRELNEQLEALRSCVEEYADPSNWDHVHSPETTTAWWKRWGHPTPWVDAQEALERVSNPASEPEA